MIIAFQKYTKQKQIIFSLIILLIIIPNVTVFANEKNNTPQDKNNSLELKQINTPFKPGEGLYISTLPDTSSFLNNIFAISDQGYVEFPIVGKVKVSNMTEIELKDYIMSSFREYIRYPNVYVKPMLRVSMLGGFARPGLYYLDYDNSIWDLVRLGGGTVDEEGIKELHWERDREDVVDDLVPYFQNGISLKNMGFKSGDQLWTPSLKEETFWDLLFSKIMPLTTFALTMFTFYVTYQSWQRGASTGLKY